MNQRYFITGTDTGVGKTMIAAALLHGARQQGLTTLGLKPVASDARWIDNQLVNEDAELLHRETTAPVSRADINPYVFEAAIAPHIAAEQQNVVLSVANIMARLDQVLGYDVDRLVCEGAGGWLVPLHSHTSETFADLARTLEFPVILVVGLKLGCINHALLTAQAIAASGLPLVGWVGNQIDPDMACIDENIETLSRRLPAPCLGIVPFIPDRDMRIPEASRIVS
jgi:dethiobiotin synthetase